MQFLINNEYIFKPILKEHFALSKMMIIFARRYTTVQHSQRYKT